LRREEFDKYVIGPSYRMSLFCYSIFKAESYPSCSHGCLYCYAKWTPVARFGNGFSVFDERSFRFFIYCFKRMGLVPPVRVSALTDPFQPLENVERRTLCLMQVALKEKVPLIINTKSNIVAESPWIDTILKLADEGLTVVQLTIPFEDEEAERLEPRAPPPSARWRAAEALTANDVPVILRLQPLIPEVNVEPEYLAKLLNEAKAVGVKQVIAETLRMPGRKAVHKVYLALGKPMVWRWERLGRSALMVPSREVRRDILKLVSAEASKRNISFASCREGFYELNTAENCCGMHFLKPYKENVLFMRPTLKEELKLLQQSVDAKITSRVERLLHKLPSRKLMEHHQLLRRMVTRFSSTEFL